MYSKIALFSLAAPALAQLSGLSSSCTSALTGIITNSEATSCLAVSSLVPALSTPANASLVPVIANYEKAVCAAPTCSNSTITSLVQNIATGCASDLSGLGIDTNSSSAQSAIQQYAAPVYLLVKDLICLRNNTESNSTSSGSSCSSGSVFCLEDFLNNLEKDLNVTLSISFLEQVVSSIGQDGGLNQLVSTIANLPSSTVCTDCNFAAYDTIKMTFPSIANVTVEGQNLSTGITEKCPSFSPTMSFPTSVGRYSSYCAASASASASASARLARWV